MTSLATESQSHRDELEVYSPLLSMFLSLCVSLRLCGLNFQTRLETENVLS